MASPDTRPAAPPASAPSPRPKPSAGVRVLGVLAKVVALAGTIALTFRFGPAGLAAGVLGGFVIPWLIALRPKHPPRRNPFRSGRLRWWPQIRPWAILSGLLAGLGTVMVLQQYSIEVLTNTLLIRGFVGGLVGGVVIPSVTWVFVVRRVNGDLGTRSAVPAVALAVFAGWLFLGPAAPALADVDGPCGAVLVAADIAIDVSQVDSRDEASAVPLFPEDEVTFFLQTDVPATSSSFELQYGPVSLPLGEGGDESLEAHADVDDYDWMGAGLYRVTGEGILEDGTSCVGAVLVDVQVDPLGTVAGAAAATFMAIGTIGVIGVSLRNASDATKSMRLLRTAALAREPHESGPAVGIGSEARDSTRHEEALPATSEGQPGPADASPGVPPWPAAVAPESTAATAPTIENDRLGDAGEGIAVAAGAGLAAAAAGRGPDDAEDDVELDRGEPMSVRQEATPSEYASGEGSLDGDVRSLEPDGGAREDASERPDALPATADDTPPFTVRDELIERAVDAEAFEHAVPATSDDERRDDGEEGDDPSRPPSA